MLIPTSRIEAAYQQIDRIFKASAHFVSEPLSDMMGATILCKDETRNPIGSFKGRGASWWMTCHPEVERIVSASAGNFGQGIAYAARNTESEVHIVAATTANPVKVASMQKLGATVQLEGIDFDAAKMAARELAKSLDGYFLEDGADVEIAEGAGTIGVELARYKHGIDAVIVPVGNGALANGIGSYLKKTKPNVRVIGVCAEQAPSMALSWKSRRVVTTDTADTIADGIAVRNPVPEALNILAGAIDEMILVSESEIKAAMQLLYRLEGIVAEPSGAVSLAGASKVAGRMADMTLATLICGSNIDPDMKRRLLG